MCHPASKMDTSMDTTSLFEIKEHPCYIFYRLKIFTLGDTCKHLKYDVHWQSSKKRNMASWNIRRKKNCDKRRERFLCIQYTCIECHQYMHVSSVESTMQKAIWPQDLLLGLLRLWQVEASQAHKAHYRWRSILPNPAQERMAEQLCQRMADNI